MFRAFLLMLACSLGASAQEIRFTDLPSVPVVPPLPPIDPAQPIILTDTMYVIDADVDLMVKGFPSATLSVTKMAGPVSIRGKFLDGDGKTELRTFKGKCVVIVEAKAVGPAHLVIVPAGAKSEADWITRQIAANQGPRPPPIVDPKVEPVAPPPIPVSGFRVLIVYDDSVPFTADMVTILRGGLVRDYLKAHCAKSADGKTEEYRIWPKSVDPTGDTQLWVKAFARKRDSVPWVIVSNGITGIECPLPAKAADVIALFDKYAK